MRSAKLNQFRTKAEPQACSVMIVAGEASSDAHAAGLVRSMKEQNPLVEVFGMGGSALRSVGADTVVDSEKSASVMGFVEILGSVRKLFKARDLLIAEALKRKPSLVILVDFPDFNLALVRKLRKKLGKSQLKVLYFISPQLWAWRKGRVKTIKRYVNTVLPIFPFEETFYHQNGVEASYVGHPFLDRPPLAIERSKFLTEIGLDANLPVLGLLPGSRHAELHLLLEPMVDAFLKVRASRPGLQAILPVAPTLDFELIRDVCAHIPGLKVIPGQAEAVLAVSDVAVVASGTATVEAALAEVPFIVVYKLSPLSYRISRLLVRGVKNFAMANLIAGKKIVPELLQDEVTASNIAQEIERYLGDSRVAAETREALGVVRRKLRFPIEDGKTAVSRAAEIALRLTE